MQPEVVRSRKDESGSAYVIALLVLVVLSILGLSLSLVTQSELLTGSNELGAHRALYGAETGVQLALASVLTTDSSVASTSLPAVELRRFLVPEQRFAFVSGVAVPVTLGTESTHFAERVTVSPFIPLREAPCDGCQSAIGDVAISKIDHAVVANSERLAWNGSATPADSVLDAAQRSAQKQLYVMITLNNWWRPRWEAIADNAQVAKVVQQTMGQGN